MALSTQPYKGARDFYPEDMLLRRYIQNKWRRVCERFGYEEYDTPILEPTELYLSKGNEEVITQQTYTFVDRGGRSVTMRTEMTPSVCRLVAGRRQELSYPLRWYSIPQCWRYERMQRGRGREFYQLNADIFGISDISADREIIEISDQIMQGFKAKRDMYSIRINSRSLSNAFMQDFLGLNEVQSPTLIKLVDRIHKMPEGEFMALAEEILSPSQRESGVLNRLMSVLRAASVEALPDNLRFSPQALELQNLISDLVAGGITNVVFDPTLMRGFDYYTNIVFEIFDTHPDNNRSMFGGGRYDGLVEIFGVDPVPAVGMAMGDITLAQFLSLHGLLPVAKSRTDIYVVLIGENMQNKASKAINELRKMGVNVAVDSSGRKPAAQLKTAIKKNVPYALFIGEKELADEQYPLKNLKTEVEERHGMQRIVSIVKDRRRK